LGKLEEDKSPIVKKTTFKKNLTSNYASSDKLLVSPIDRPVLIIEEQVKLSDVITMIGG
jgi:hypothetical protein